MNLENNRNSRRFKDVTKIKNITKDTAGSYGENPTTRFLRDVSMPRIAGHEEKSNSESPNNNSLNRTALISEETVDRWLRDYAAKSSPKYAQAYITRMAPGQFLKLTTSTTGRLTINQQTQELDAEKLIEATRQQPIQLIIRDGEVVGHEGRHRVNALMRAGGIRALVENAVFLDTEVHEHHDNNAKNDNIAIDHKLHALGQNADGIALYKVTVEEYLNDPKYTNLKRFHNLVYIEKVADIAGGRDTGTSRAGVSTNGKSTTGYTVADIYEYVKPGRWGPGGAGHAGAEEAGREGQRQRGRLQQDGKLDCQGQGGEVFGKAREDLDWVDPANRFEKK